MRTTTKESRIKGYRNGNLNVYVKQQDFSVPEIQLSLGAQHFNLLPAQFKEFTELVALALTELEDPA